MLLCKAVGNQNHQFVFSCFGSSARELSYGPWPVTATIIGKIDSLWTIKLYIFYTNSAFISNTILRKLFNTILSPFHLCMEPVANYIISLERCSKIFPSLSPTVQAIWYSEWRCTDRICQIKFSNFVLYPNSSTTGNTGTEFS
jgi:hypothetical protein